MNRTRTNSIRQKLLNWLLILVLPSLLLGSVSAYYTASYFSNLVYDRALFRVALAVAEQVDVKNGEVKIDLPESTLKLIEFDIDDWIYYQIQDANHHVIFGYIKQTKLSTTRQTLNKRHCTWLPSTYLLLSLALMET